MREIQKKILPEYFNAIADGQKTYELRLADWECSPGDVLILNEIDSTTKQPTGRSLRRKVGYVGKTKDVSLFPEEDVQKFGWQIISLLEDES